MLNDNFGLGSGSYSTGQVISDPDPDLIGLVIMYPDPNPDR